VILYAKSEKVFHVEESARKLEFIDNIEKILELLE
jgi:hypothetical protein